MTKFKQIKDLYSHLPDFLKECEHNANTLWLINRVEQLESTLEFTRLHLKSMEGYSLVWGAIHEINKALKEYP